MCCLWFFHPLTHGPQVNSQVFMSLINDFENCSLWSLAPLLALCLTKSCLPAFLCIIAFLDLDFHHLLSSRTDSEVSTPWFNHQFCPVCPPHQPYPHGRHLAFVTHVTHPLTNGKPWTVPARRSHGKDLVIQSNWMADHIGGIKHGSRKFTTYFISALKKPSSRASKTTCSTDSGGWAVFSFLHENSHARTPCLQLAQQPITLRQGGGFLIIKLASSSHGWNLLDL